MDFPTSHNRNRYVHPRNQMLRKCCGCIHLRVGAAFTCLFWMGFSLYLATLSFQSKSPFFSYMDKTPLIVCGVVNLLLVIIGFFGLVIMFLNEWEYIRDFSHVIWLVLFIVLADGFINVVYFITQHDQYLSKCIQSAAETLSSSSTANSTTTAVVPDINTRDYYNCDRLFEDEVKFSLIFIILMIILYIYWGICIYSYSHKRGLTTTIMTGHQTGGPQPSTIIAGANAVPPSVIATAGAGRPKDIIILNNQKPAKFSLKNLYQQRRTAADEIQPGTKPGLMPDYPDGLGH